MFNMSFFSMLEGYLPKGFGKSCTNALVRGIREGEFGRDSLNRMKDTIEESLKLYKDEGKQLFHVANFIKEELREEWNYIKPMGDDNNGRVKIRIDRLSDFLENIIFERVDYYEAAKQLTKYYKENQKNKEKVHTKAA